MSAASHLPATTTHTYTSPCLTDPPLGTSSTSLKLTRQKQNSWFSPKLLLLSKQHYSLMRRSTENAAVILLSSFSQPSLIQCFLQNTLNIYSLLTIRSEPLSSWPWMTQGKNLLNAFPASILASCHFTPLRRVISELLKMTVQAHRHHSSTSNSLITSRLHLECPLV